MSAATADAPAFARGGGVSNSVRDGAARLGRTMPSRMSRESRPAGSDVPVLETGSRRATGRPRSTIRTASPPLRPSMRALKRFLASVMLAFFIRAIIAFSYRLFKLDSLSMTAERPSAFPRPIRLRAAELTAATVSVPMRAFRIVN
jgi:hypothetical protein